MRNMMILAGAAALALAGPALSQGKGNGGGGPKNEGGGKAAKVERGGGGGPKNDGGGKAAQQQKRGSEQRSAKADRPAQAKREVKVERQAKVERADRPAQGERRQMRETGQQGRKVAKQEDYQRGRNGGDRKAEDRMVRADFDRDTLVSPEFRNTGLIDGCPPGLAAKNNGCLPPGQAKRRVGSILPAALGTALLPPLLRSWYPDDERYLYRTDEGYVYRIDRQQDLVDGFFPLDMDYNGAYYVGGSYPQEYLGTYNVPAQYQPWYADGGDDYYRYGDGAIYRVDRGGGLIEAVVSLLAGDLVPGQQLPSGYDVYNVPTDYRDRYADGPDSMYRYNDGHIYEVDPTTRLVQAIVETLV